MRLSATPYTKADLLILLDQVRELIERDDSFEGMVNWLMPEPDDPTGTDFRVEARYRHGNSMGQGGFSIIGDWVDEEGHRIQHIDPGKGLPSA